MLSSSSKMILESRASLIRDVRSSFVHTQCANAPGRQQRRQYHTTVWDILRSVSIYRTLAVRDIAPSCTVPIVLERVTVPKTAASPTPSAVTGHQELVARIIIEERALRRNHGAAAPRLKLGKDSDRLCAVPGRLCRRTAAPTILSSTSIDFRRTDAQQQRLSY